MDNKSQDTNCYEIKCSEELGRYLVARRDISPLEVVIRESPLVCAPADDPNYEDMGRMCLGCFARIPPNSSTSLCSKCGWPVCDVDCQTISHHSSNECEFFEKEKISFKTLPFQHLLNETIFILRCILLKQRNPVAFSNIILKFEHHTQVRMEKADCVEKDKKVLANLNEIQTLSNSKWFDLDEEEIVQISGIINVNAFSSTKLEDECRSRRVRRRVTICQCLYPTATLLAHQCVPNATWTLSASPHFEQTIRTTVPIKKGEMIAIAYAPQEIMWPTLQRLISSNDVAHFICHCFRCQDPTELGSFIGAIKCAKCVRDIGGENDDVRFLLPDNPIDPESPWSCQNLNCGATKTVEQVIKIVHQIERRFNRIKNSAYSTQTEISELEELYNESLENYLHKNHYLLQEISLRIVNRNSLSVYCLDADDLERFLFHCNSLLNLSRVLSPGFCRARALVQFYTGQAMMVKARKFMKGRDSVDNKTLYDMFSPIYKLQKDSYSYFKTEDENDNRHRAVKGYNQYVACLVEEMEECLKAMQIQE